MEVKPPGMPLVLLRRRSPSASGYTNLASGVATKAGPEQKYGAVKVGVARPLAPAALGSFAETKPETTARPVAETQESATEANHIMTTHHPLCNGDYFVVLRCPCPFWTAAGSV
jgi:hypothetical protein